MKTLYLLLLISVFTASFGQVFFKMSGARLTSPLLYLGFILYGFSAFLWIYALKYLPLSRVYPFTFLTFALVLVLSYLIFGERLSPINFVGIALIVVGVYLTVLQ